MTDFITVTDDEIIIAPIAIDEDLPEDEDALSRMGLTLDELPF